MCVQDISKRTTLQPLLESEARAMTWVYSAALYGLSSVNTSAPEAVAAAQEDMQGSGILFTSPG